jgi:hypothetical protein
MHISISTRWNKVEASTAVALPTGTLDDSLVGGLGLDPYLDPVLEETQPLPPVTIMNLDTYPRLGLHRA